MSDDDRLSSSLQESLLTALCFDNEKINTVLPIITAELFEGTYNEIAKRVLDYRQRYGRPPEEAHIDDLFDDILGDPNHKQHNTYNKLIIGMLEQFKNGFDITYITTRTSEFARRQQLKAGVIQAAERYNQGGDNISEDVEKILYDTINQRVTSLDTGTFLGESDRVLKFLDKDQFEYCKTGIAQLDRNGIYPVKKQIFMFVAPPKKGKSFFLTHIGKMALLQGWNVAEVTLEMSEELKCERYIQALYSVSRRNESFIRTAIKTDQLGRMIDLEIERHKAKMSFEDPNIRIRLQQRMQQWHNKLNRLVVKEFATGGLTMRQLELWLDSLEASRGFYPDLLMVDYPALMDLGDSRHLRQNLGQTIVKLRGLAVSRNMAVVAPHQINREGSRASRVKFTHIAEDISSAFTCDTMVSYSQTDQEYKLGLARLRVELARSERSGFTVLISQAYKSGQFILESVMLNDKYDDLVKGKAGSVDDDEPEEEDEC